MSEKKIALMLVAVVAIGIFALPSTMSVFSGQHTWYDIASDGVPCVKCHADKYEEFSMTDVHSSFARRDSSDVCYVCHRADPDLTYAKGGGGGPGVQTHAASTIACMACHEYEAQVRDNNQGPFAGGFEQPSGSPFNYGGVVASQPGSEGVPQKHKIISEGSHAVHNAYVQGAVDSYLMEDSNEACIACHTAIPMEIDWSLGYAMHSQSVADSLGDWTVGQFEAAGAYTVTTYSDGYGDDASTTEPHIDHDVTPSVPSKVYRSPDDWLHEP
jgi:hypothetical protein